MEINDITLVQTCGACPEQYDAFIGDEQVGYLRLRHGYFYVEYPDSGGETIFEANPKGDGVFHSEEREHYLARAKMAILIRLLKGVPVKDEINLQYVAEEYKPQNINFNCVCQTREQFELFSKFLLDFQRIGGKVVC